MVGDKISTSMCIHYRSIKNYQSTSVLRDRTSVSDGNQIVYRNIVNAMKEAIDKYCPCQHEQLLKPSQIDSKLKHIVTKRPQIIQPTSLQ
ncbi:unnamed protein product [Rotaria sordida]|uniref:Uncharacterized protein n=1 Tax=Rotaria sordida TaxID=392033 RepID=A0A814FGR2_9BILA|nr:unnamed protein product [Rotaria sordida]